MVLPDFQKLNGDTSYVCRSIGTFIALSEIGDDVTYFVFNNERQAADRTIPEFDLGDGLVHSTSPITDIIIMDIKPCYCDADADAFSE